MPDLAELTIGERLGDGGEGHVFLAVGPNRHRYALKILETNAQVDPQVLDARLGALYPDSRERAVVPVLEHAALDALPASLRRQLKGVGKRGLALLMPFLDGASLAAISKKAPLQPAAVAAVLAGVAARLALLPEGASHGDVRASNILVGRAGEVSLVDPKLLEAPTPEEDLRALGALGRELMAPDAPDALRQLIEDLVAAAPAPSASEATHRFTVLAQALGAPVGNFGRLLGPLAAAAASQVAALEPSPRVARRNWMNLFWIGYAVSLGVLGITLGTVTWRWLSPQRVSITGLRQGPEGQDQLRLQGMDESLLYDETGMVTYPDEQVHLLKDFEHAAHDDGLIVATMLSDQPRIAIYSNRGKLLWEHLKPLSGEQLYLDVKPGIYQVEIDRNLGDAGLQVDRRQVEVDVLHPFRFEVSRGMSAPEPEPR